MSVLKRLKKELKNYNEKPIPYTGVEPCDDNFHLWNCVIEIKDEENSQSCPLHFLVEFPPEYPQKYTKSIVATPSYVRGFIEAELILLFACFCSMGGWIKEP